MSLKKTTQRERTLAWSVQGESAPSVLAWDLPSEEVVDVFQKDFQKDRPVRSKTST